VAFDSKGGMALQFNQVEGVAKEWKPKVVLQYRNILLM
jgi:hypothetical protein